MGRALAIDERGAHGRPPLGEVPIDAEFALALQQRFPALHNDPAAHRAEHAAEVETSFPAVEAAEFADRTDRAPGPGSSKYSSNWGMALADVLPAGRGDPVLIVASSDMNHYESDVVTRAKDHHAIERILTMDARGLFDVVTQQNISMCGFGPAVAMLTAARQLGAKAAELVKYATSGDISGDRDMVVGYAGVVVA